MNSHLAFSFWGKEINLRQPSFDQSSYVTTTKLINYIYKNLIQSPDGSGKINVNDFDIYLSAEYFFSESIFTNFGLFLRNRRLNSISNFGFGDVDFNIIARFAKYPEIYGLFGAKIPLAGEPDEELAVFQRINLSSFGLDIPLGIMIKLPFDTANSRFSVIANGGYTFRFPYQIFGQVVSPGDILSGALGFSASVRNFFLTTSEISHNLHFGAFFSLMHGFPEDQRTALYRVSGTSWDILKTHIFIAATFKKQSEKFGEKIIKDWLNLSLNFSFPIYEKSFLNPNYPDYAIIRFPYMERTNPGFYSSINLTFIF